MPDVGHEAVTFDELSARYRQLKDELERLAVDAQRAVQERDHVAQERERVSQERDRASHERDEYKKLYELVSLELERTRRHLFGKKAETVDPSQTQLAFLLATASEKLARSSPLPLVTKHGFGDLALGAAEARRAERRHQRRAGTRLAVRHLAWREAALTVTRSAWTPARCRAAGSGIRRASRAPWSGSACPPARP
jgi:hypothetical protein